MKALYCRLAEFDALDLDDLAELDERLFDSTDPARTEWRRAVQESSLRLSPVGDLNVPRVSAGESNPHVRRAGHVGKRSFGTDARRRAGRSTPEPSSLARRNTLVSMKMVSVLAAVAASAVVGGSAVAADQPVQARLYFLSDSGRTLIPAQRTARVLTPYAAVAALLEGPTRAERKSGMAPALPANARLKGVAVLSRHAIVALESPTLGRLSTIPRLRVIGSVTYTLTSLPSLKSVRFIVDGRPWGVYDHAGRIIRDYRRGTLAHPWLPACAPAEGCFAP